MLNKIGFKNYKSFKNYTELELRPITILVGQNSSGKSSILKLIKLLTQSFWKVESALPLLMNGPLVNLYNYENLFHKNSNKLSINLNVDLIASPFDELIEFHELYNSNFNIALDIFKKQKSATINYNFYKKSTYFTTPFIFDSLGVNLENKKNEKMKLKKKKNTDIIDLNFTLNYEESHFIIDTSSRLKKDFNHFIKKHKLTEVIEICLIKLRGNKELKRVDAIGFVDKFIKLMKIAKYQRKCNSLFPPILSDIYETNIYDELLEHSDVFTHKLERLHFLSEEIIDFFKSNNNFKVLFNENVENGVISKLLTIEKIFNKEININDNNDIKKINEVFNLIKVSKVKIKYLEKLFLEIIYNILYEMEKQILSKTNNYIESFLRPSINRFRTEQIYGVPLRKSPAKNYSKFEIEEYFDIFNSTIRKSFDHNFIIFEQTDIYLNEINKYLNLLEIPYKVEFIELTDNELIEKRFSIMLKDIKQKKKLFLEETGFGISQILPILYSISKGKNSLNLIEQPELHLHPNTQFKLAEIFTAAFPIKTEEDGKKYRHNGRYLIETHSEHLIRGFQVQVAKGKLIPEDIAIFYINKDDKGISSAKLIELDEKGNFTSEWPTGFLDLTAKAAFELLNNQIKKN